MLAGHLTDRLHGVKLPPGVSSGGGASPAALSQLPAPVRDVFVGSYADALQTVFLVAAPVGLAAFLLTLLLPEIPLRKTVRGGPLCRFEDHPSSTLARLAERLGVDVERLHPMAVRLVERGLLERTTSELHDVLALTPAGRATLDASTAARRELLAELVAQWDPERHPELAARLQELARQLLADDEHLLYEARLAMPAGA